MGTPIQFQLLSFLFRSHILKSWMIRCTDGTHHKRFSVPQQSDVVSDGDFVENITNICVCCWCTKQTISWVDIFNILLLNGFYLLVNQVKENISTLVGRFVANILCKQQQPHQEFIYIFWSTAFYLNFLSANASPEVYVLLNNMCFSILRSVSLSSPRALM